MFNFIILTGENVALRKAAEQSSVYTVYGISFGADRAVDGNSTNVVDMMDNSCMHTTDLPGTSQAWWRVDLGQIYNITMISITNRNWPDHAGISICE